MAGRTIIIPDKFPVVSLSASNMVFPDVMSQVHLSSPSGLKILEEAMNDRCPLALAVMSKLGIQNTPDRFYDTGVVASLEVVPEDLSVLLRGLYRVNVLSWERSIVSDDEDGYWIARVKKFDDRKDEFFIEKDEKLVVHPNSALLFRAVFSKLKKVIKRFVEVSREYDAEGLGFILDNFENYDFSNKLVMDQFIWTLLSVVPEATASEKQAVLANTSIVERIGGVVQLFGKSIAILQMDNDLNNKGNPGNPRGVDSGNLVKRDDDFIRGAHPELIKRWDRYKKIKDTLNPDAAKAIVEDFEHLKNSNQGQAEWNAFVNHLDCLLDLYSATLTPQEKDISKVEEKLAKSHYGLNNVKERISDYLAVKTLNPKGKAPVLCFIGPPGVGKTSMGKAVADAMGSKFIRLSLGGVRDEADIRGHRLTYIGAIPGKIIQEIRRAGVKNPVFVLDEVDKLTNDFRGDPSSALLEVLDPEQNYSFQDHYVGAPFDLSNVLFLCTANLEASIQPALLDRMNVINISGYTEQEKVQIAKEYLVKKQLSEVGLADKGITLRWQNDDPDKVIASIVSGYTREAGVRELERQIHKVFSGWGRQYLKEADDKKPTELIMTEELIEKFLKAPSYLSERARATEVGEITGLAWTSVGGATIYVQSKIYDYQKFSVLQTGLQGKVMEEAGQVALSLLRDELEKIGKASIMNNKFIHIHIPEGAVPKDGPSAGITTLCSLYSAALKKVAKPYIAMTGEITLTGMVTGVGGIKSKVLAAHRYGIKEIILPKINRRDIEENISDDVKKDLKFHFVSHISEVLPIVFTDNPA